MSGLTRPQQKAALTRAIKSGNPEKLVDACKKAIAQWNLDGYWPDDWSAWDRALTDARFKLGGEWPPSLDDLDRSMQ